MSVTTIDVSRVDVPNKDPYRREAICPLSMIAGKPVLCHRECVNCIPESIAAIANNLAKLDYLSFLNDMFGNGAARDGLNEVASAISDLAANIEKGDSL